VAAIHPAPKPDAVKLEAGASAPDAKAGTAEAAALGQVQPASESGAAPEAATQMQPVAGADGKAEGTDAPLPSIFAATTLTAAKADPSALGVIDGVPGAAVPTSTAGTQQPSAEPSAGREADDLVWQGEEPSWLPTGGHYERDRAGLAALAAELQAWLDGGHPEAPSFIRDPQRLVDELRVSIAALGEPGGVFEMLLPSAVAPRPTAVRADDSRREGAHSGEEDYRPPLKQASCARSGSGSDSGSGSGSGSGSAGPSAPRAAPRAAALTAAAGSRSGPPARRLKRPKSGLLSPEGDEEAADSVAEARARGALVPGRHGGLPTIASLTVKKTSVKSRLMKKLRLG